MTFEKRNAVMLAGIASAFAILIGIMVSAVLVAGDSGCRIARSGYDVIVFRQERSGRQVAVYWERGRISSLDRTVASLQMDFGRRGWEVTESLSLSRGERLPDGCLIRVLASDKDRRSPMYLLSGCGRRSCPAEADFSGGVMRCMDQPIEADRHLQIAAFVFG